MIKDPTHFVGRKKKYQTWLAPKVIWTTTPVVFKSRTTVAAAPCRNVFFFVLFFTGTKKKNRKKKKTRSNGNRKRAAIFSSLFSSSLIVSFIPIFFFLPRVRRLCSLFHASCRFARGPARACVFLGRWRAEASNCLSRVRKWKMGGESKSFLGPLTSHAHSKERKWRTSCQFASRGTPKKKSIKTIALNIHCSF